MSKYRISYLGDEAHLEGLERVALGYDDVLCQVGYTYDFEQAFLER